MANKLEKLLWNIAGAELEVLEKCRTDHKKFSAIGTTILMTTVIAFFAGTAAAWYFTKSGDEESGNLIGSMLFGILWAALIFSIDRSLVITLKKDPTQTGGQRFIHSLTPLFSRAILACIIAFMVSIPLELVIFNDFIRIKQFEFNQYDEKGLALKSRAYGESQRIDSDIAVSGQNMARLDSLNNQLKPQVTQLAKQIEQQRKMLNKPNTVKYNEAYNKYHSYDKSFELATQRLAYATNYADSIQCQKEIDKIRNKRRPFYTTMQEEKNAWNKKVNNKIKEFTEEKTKIENDISYNNENYRKEEKRIARNRDNLDSLAIAQDNLINDFNRVSREGNHFIQDFRVLEYAVSRAANDGNIPTEWYVLWLIRLLFFIIEILPTVVKIVTPIGSYDRMVYAEEKQVMMYLNSEEYMQRIRNMHDLELQIKEKQLQLQQDMEIQLKQEILEKMKDAQIEVANANIHKWKNHEMSLTSLKS